MYAKKELTMKQVLIRKTIQLVLVEIIVLTHVIEWYQDSISAKKMTEELWVFQKKYEQG